MPKLKISSQFARNLGKKQILVPHLNNWFANGKFPDHIPLGVNMNKEEDDAFHPSSSLSCLRVLQAKLDDLLPKRENTMESNKTFFFGHYIHSLIQWVCVEELKFCTWEDVEVDCDFHLETPKGNPYRVRGFPDIERCIVPNHEPVLVDIKTVNAHVYGLAYLPDRLQEHYTAQVNLYLNFAGLNKGILLMVEKDHPHRFKEIEIDRDDDLVAKIVGRWESVVDARAEGRISPCTCEKPVNCPAKGLYDTDEKIDFDIPKQPS